MGYSDNPETWESEDDARLAWVLALSISRRRAERSGPSPRTEGTPHPRGGGSRSHSASLSVFVVSGGGLSRAARVRRTGMDFGQGPGGDDAA